MAALLSLAIKLQAGTVMVRIKLLTLSGLAPMIILLAFFLAAQASWAADLLGLYVLGIVVFMLGTLWGEAKELPVIALNSNVLFFVALLAYWLCPLPVWLVIAAAVLAVTLLLELKQIKLTKDYRELRIQVTVYASAVLLIGAALIGFVV